MPTLASIDDAIGHHRAGRLAEAEAIYRAILADQPAEPDALHLLGSIALGAGRIDEAAALIERAATARPDLAPFLTSLGKARRAQGRLGAAAEAFRRALALAPDSIAARVDLGMALEALGRPGEARTQFDAALAAAPGLAEQLNDAGVALRAQGRVADAVERYRQALAVRPDLAQAHSNLGATLRTLGDLEGAVAACRRALAIRPDFAEAHLNLGQALADLGQADQAIAGYRRALQLRPDLAAAHYCLGIALYEQEAFAEAAASYEAALAIQPDDARTLHNLGVALSEGGALDQARSRLEAALALAPDAPATLQALGLVLERLGLPHEAEVRMRRAIALAPGFAAAHHGLGRALRAQARTAEAIASCRRALAILEDEADSNAASGARAWTAARRDQALAATHADLGDALLVLGDFAAAWPHYEWRRRLKQIWRPAQVAPAWDGGDLEGKTIVLDCEQGLGDAIQFVRFAPMVTARGARALLRCPAPLSRLFAGAGLADQVIGHGPAPPPHDLHVPLLSLPGLLGVEVASIPAAVPYLRADPALAAAWRERLAGRSGLKVGVAWRGNPLHNNDRVRSMTAAVFAAGLDVPGITLVSLQKDAAAAEIAALGPEAIDAGPGLGDMGDTAALVAGLDLVIAVDTAICHLAGALAIPVWTLISHAPDWRWMLGRADSPWYPTMRLFRQPSRGDWASVMADVRAALDLASASGQARPGRGPEEP
jgi:tetratricopeptide (TPR) repeat protein